MTDQPTFSELEISMGRVLTDAVVPEETEFFDELIAQSGKSALRRDHSLGFGVSAEASGAIAAILVGIGKIVLGFLWENGKDAVGNIVKDLSEELRTAIKARMKAWSDSKAKGTSPIVLSSESMTSLLATVKSKANERGMTQDETEKLCDTLSTLFLEKVS
jgi:hypothetical protein